MNTALIVGASRGIGHALALGLVALGWRVIATVRGDPPADLIDAGVRIETLDTTDDAGVAALGERLAGTAIDLLLVNAGVTTGNPRARIEDVGGDEFAHVLTTNALAPMRVLAALGPLVPDDGLIAVMSSGLGSVAQNTTGSYEAYRASKAALNTLLRSYAARPENAARPLLALAPGWIRTELGGGEATYSLEESVAPLLDVLIGRRGRPGLAFLDRFGADVPW